MLSFTDQMGMGLEGRPEETGWIDGQAMED